MVVEPGAAFRAYAEDFKAFAREVLGLPLTPAQEAMLKRVALASGPNVGKAELVRQLERRCQELGVPVYRAGR